MSGSLQEQPWFELFEQISGLAKDRDDDDAIERFEALQLLLPGKAVYHGTGWGEGVVEEIDLDEQSLTVRFRQDGRSRAMPFTTGLDVLRPLPDDDLRARLLIDLEGLKKDAEDDPSKLIQAVARLQHGRTTAKDIKQWLAGEVVVPSAWTGWWKKAKVAASKDPWLAVDNPARPVFVLRKRALTPEEEMRQSMERALDLADLLDVIRGPLSLEPDEALAAAMLDELGNRVGEADAKASARIEAALALARHGRAEMAEAGQLVARTVDEKGSFGAVAASLSGAPLRKEALAAFAAAKPELWSDDLINDLAGIPVALLDTVTDQLVAAGRGDALANRLRIFLMTPSRQPATVVKLAKRYAGGLLDEVEDAPTVTEVVMGILHLAETQAPKADRGDKPAKAVMKGVLELIAAKRNNLMERFAAGAHRTDMERAMGVLARCKAMPAEVTHPMDEACRTRFPDLVPRDETPFWESNNIFASAKGIARREEEYRVLCEVKIPENSEVIGKAAAFGDLSENYEWTAAIEQQRQLTEKAAAMEAELKLARAIEEQELEEGVVSPGTKVTYEQDGETKKLTIMGPWDIGDGVVSYRAPVAEGMLGCKAGEKAVLELPSGDVDVTVLTVERAV